MHRRFLLAATATLAAACGASPIPRPKNLLILSIDTLRADELGAYGKSPSITPALDRLAAASVVFERAHSAASWTLPSFGATFTSLFPSSTSLWTFESKLADGFTTLPELFHAAGFATYGIASHVYFNKDFGLQQGFDGFDDELAHKNGEAGWTEVTSPAVSKKAVSWIEQRKTSGAREPWLLFVHFFDPHIPYIDHEAADPSDTHRPERARYESEIAFTDGYVGAVLDELARSGFADDTAVVFLSDHGESFLEHPPINRHSYGLYEEELHVPLILRVPGVGARRVPTPVRSVDLLPTLCELYGVADPAAELREGASLAPFLLGRTRDVPAQLAEIRLKDGFHANALVRGRYKLYEDVSNARFQLFDLETDSREQHDLGDADPALLGGLQAELRARVANSAAKGAAIAAGGSMQLAPDVLERLRKLGYSGEDEPTGSSDAKKENTSPTPGPKK